MKYPLACVALGFALCSAGSRAPGGAKTEKDFTSVAPADLDVELVQPMKDPKTGFLVGGKNTTTLIRSLKEINGVPLKNLEEEMRPGKASTKGFLGKDEKLLEVLAADNDLVLNTLGRTHQELAKHLLIVGGIAKRQVGPKEDDRYTFRYHNRRLRVAKLIFRGFVVSPFEDGTRTNTEVTLENLDNGKKVKYSLLVPLMVERYGFYEGKGTPYRVEPRDIVAVFDFLAKKE